MKMTKRYSGLKIFDQIAAALKTKKYAKVGILGNQNFRTGPMGNAELGLIQEFGTADGKIPPRSFLRMPLEQDAKNIAKSLMNKRQKIEQAIADGDENYVIEQLGIAGEASVQRAFSTGGFGQWQGNAESTKERKGSSSPLIDTGELRESITSEVSE